MRIGHKPEAGLTLASRGVDSHQVRRFESFLDELLRHAGFDPSVDIVALVASHVCPGPDVYALGDCAFEVTAPREVNCRLRDEEGHDERQLGA